MKKSRAALLGLLSATLAFPLGAVSQPAHAASSTSFTLNAAVLDGGQQVTSITLETTRYRINPKGLSVNTFQVRAKGTNPFAELGSAVLGTYDQYRTVTGVSLNSDGDVVIELLSGPDAPAASTLGYAYAADAATKMAGRNVQLDLEYTLTQRQPLRAAGRPLTFSSFTQGAVVDPEVDDYSTGTSDSGLNYRLFIPREAKKSNRRPLIVWLHGAGEGGWSGAQDSALPLLGNRGALGFSTPKAQRIFGGAYVVAPQATDFWMNDPAMGYAAKLKSLLDELVAQYPVDADRIYVVGASNGGYQTLALETRYPKYFAAAVPICPPLKLGDTDLLPEAQLLAARRTPTWIVQAKNDPVVPFESNGQRASDVIGNAHLTAYPDVVWDGTTYNGHWSWIYVAHNDPQLPNGKHLFQWMARQHR